MLIYIITIGVGVSLIIASVVWALFDRRNKFSKNADGTVVKPSINEVEETGKTTTASLDDTSAPSIKVDTPIISDMISGSSKSTVVAAPIVTDNVAVTEPIGVQTAEVNSDNVEMIKAETEEIVRTKELLEENKAKAKLDQATEAYIAAEKQTSSVFDDAFRDELRNRGRLHFEKIISENAMFLQQDLRLTTSQLNEFMKDEIKRVLKDEFTSYEESISSARDLALESIKKTQDAIESQRAVLEKQLNDQVEVEKKRIMDRFGTRMTEIVSHHIITAFGDELQLDSQMEFILRQLEDNKAEILEDVRNVA